MGNMKVEASFLENYKGGIMTLLKVLVMFWIMNLINQNTGGNNENEDFLTSTIKKGLEPGNSRAGENIAEAQTVEKGFQE